MRTQDEVAAMQCPVCRVPLSMSDRQGIEIDYCPQCRGVWLDRGELDKIIERSAPAPQQQSGAAPQPSQPLHQAGEIAHAVVVAVLESLDVELVDDRVAVPQGIVAGVDDRAVEGELEGGPAHVLTLAGNSRNRVRRARGA